MAHLGLYWGGQLALGSMLGPDWAHAMWPHGKNIGEQQQNIIYCGKKGVTSKTSKILIYILVALWSGWAPAHFFNQSWHQGWGLIRKMNSPQKGQSRRWFFWPRLRCFKRGAQGSLIGEPAVLLLWWYLFCGQTNDLSFQGCQSGIPRQHQIN